MEPRTIDVPWQNLRARRNADGLAFIRVFRGLFFYEVVDRLQIVSRWRLDIVGAVSSTFCFYSRRTEDRRAVPLDGGLQ